MTGVHPDVDVVHRFYVALGAADLDTILELTDPEIEVRQTPEVPWGGEFHGHEGLGEFFLTIRTHITSRVTHAAMFSAGDRVVQVGRTAGTVNATGASFDIDEVHLLTVRDGRIVRFEAHIDTPAMLAALVAPGSG